MAETPVALLFPLFRVHLIGLGIRWVLTKVGTGFGRLFSRSNEAEPTGKRKGDDSHIARNKVVGDEEKENKKQSQ